MQTRRSTRAAAAPKADKQSSASTTNKRNTKDTNKKLYTATSEDESSASDEETSLKPTLKDDPHAPRWPGWEYHPTSDGRPRRRYYGRLSNWVHGPSATTQATGFLIRMFKGFKGENLMTDYMTFAEALELEEIMLEDVVDDNVDEEDGDEE